MLSSGYQGIICSKLNTCCFVVRHSDAPEMKRGLSAYMEVLRLVRKLPPETRPYYAKYARENFVNYREVEEVAGGDGTHINELFRRAYTHATWVLNKYSVDQAAADKLKDVCGWKRIDTAV